MRPMRFLLPNPVRSALLMLLLANGAVGEDVATSALPAVERSALIKKPAMPGLDSTAPHFTRVIPLSAFRRKGRWIQGGLRVEHLGKKLRVAESSFPSGGEPEGIMLPSHLGGGALFYQSTGSDGAAGTEVYRADSWTGALVHLARAPFGVRSVVAGFDRVYLIGVALSAALDPESGEGMSLAPLPPVATISGLTFDGPERALLAAPLVGVLYTRDSGLSWSPLNGAADLRVSLNGSGLFVTTKEGLRRVEENGSLVQPQPPPSLLTWESFLSEKHNPVDRGATLAAANNDELDLLAVVTRGTSFGRVSAAIDQGRLLTLYNDDELALHSAATRVAASANCLPAEPSSGLSGTINKSKLLFVCQDKTTEVYSIDAAVVIEVAENSRRGGRAQLDTLFHSERRRRILGRGQGAILLSGSCEENGKHPRSDEEQLCLVSPLNQVTISSPKRSADDKGAPINDRSFSWAISEDSLWQFSTEKSKGEIRSQRLWQAPSRTRTASSRTWNFSEEAFLKEFLRTGTLLPSATRTPDGYSLWASNGDHFVGLLLGEDKEPSFFAIQRPLARALFDGARALLWGAAGFAKQSLDGGRNFQEISLPYRSGDGSPEAVLDPATTVEMGCSSVGCVVGDTVRIGWQIKKPLPLKKAKVLTLPPLGPGRFHFKCSDTTVGSLPRKTEIDGSLPPFWESVPPSVKVGEEILSMSLPLDLGRLYAWGPDGKAWTREGQVELRFVNAWDPQKLRRTAPTRQLFSSLTETKRALGTLDLASSFPTIAFDPSGDAGVLLLRTRDSTDLLLFRADEALRLIPGAHELGLRGLLNAVETQGTWFAAFQKGDHVAVLKLDPQGISEIVDLSLGAEGLRSFQVVRSTEGDLGVSLEADLGLLVYPLSLKGELGEPILIAHRANRPPSCAPEASGFIIDRAMTVAPYLEGKEELPLRVNDLRARWLVGIGEPCLDTMTARTRAEPEASQGSTRGNAVPLALLNSEVQGRRSVLACE